MYQISLRARIDNTDYVVGSVRDILIANKQDNGEIQKAIVQNDELLASLKSIGDAITKLENEIAQLQLDAHEAFVDQDFVLVDQINAQIEAKQIEVNTLIDSRESLQTQRTELINIAAVAAADKIKPRNADGTKSPNLSAKKSVNSNNSNSGTYGTATLTKPGDMPLNYNASAVKDAYFSSSPFFNAEMNFKGNQPVAIAKAANLWQGSKGSKGMIVTSASTLKAWNSGAARPQGAKVGDNLNYGFQFQYNPGTVSMNYYTAPNIDVGLQTSGQDLFNLAGVAGSQGSINFDIIINRVMDFRNFSSTGQPKANAKDNYSKPPQTIGEWRELWNKGTMYDVEYLLRTIMGFTLDSYLRGTKTSDMGWLPATPVELHLGHKLRYWGTINSLDLKHVIFDERMVPLFTTVSISFARLPDYPALGQ
jgi:hypothetical protein